MRQNSAWMPKLASTLLTARGVAVFWLVSAVAFITMLWAVSPGRTLQDALTAELLQGHLAGGYQLRNPPLYEWLLWSVQQLVGTGPLSYLIVRYSLIAALGILFYVALLRTVADQRVAAAFSLSLVLFFWFGWESHHSVSHSLAMLVAALALWIAALAFVERMTIARGFGLGLVIGIGIMAKWSFLLVVLSLGAALALTPATRRFFTHPASLMVLVGACLPLIPFILWLSHMDFHLVIARTVLEKPEAGQRMLRGAIDFIIGIPLVLLPWLLVVLVLAWRLRRQSIPEDISQATATRLAFITAVLAPALMTVFLVVLTSRGVALFGITRFAIHYLFPFCLFAALWIAGRVARRVEPERFAAVLGVTSLITACVIFLIKLGSFYVLLGVSEATHLLPYERLADELNERGLGHAQFVTLSPRDAGNLRIYLRNGRALSFSARIEPPPPDPAPDRPCVLLWSVGDFVPPSPPATEGRGARRFLRRIGVAPGAEQPESIVADWAKPLIGPQKRSLWHLLRGSSIESACRRLAVTGVLWAGRTPKMDGQAVQ